MQASIRQPANSSIIFTLQAANLKRPSERPSKAIVFLIKLSEKTTIFPWKQVSWNHPSVAHLHFSTSHSQGSKTLQDLVCSHGTRSLGSQEQSGNFQLCLGSCFKQLLTQRGRSPNLIFGLEISAWFCVLHSFLSQLGGVDRPQPSQNWHCSRPLKRRCKAS